MTTGQLLFYAGAALLGLTVILLIIFLIKRPKYQPEGAASGPAPTVVPNKPVSLSDAAQTEIISSETQLISGTASAETELISGAGSALTELISSPNLSGETELLPHS